MTYVDIYDTIMSGKYVSVIDINGNERVYFKNIRGYARQRFNNHKKTTIFHNGNNDSVNETSKVNIYDDVHHYRDRN